MRVLAICFVLISVYKCVPVSTFPSPLSVSTSETDDGAQRVLFYPLPVVVPASQVDDVLSKNPDELQQLLLEKQSDNALLSPNLPDSVIKKISDILKDPITMELDSEAQNSLGSYNAGNLFGFDTSSTSESPESVTFFTDELRDERLSTAAVFNEMKASASSLPQTTAESYETRAPPQQETIKPPVKLLKRLLGDYLPVVNPEVRDSTRPEKNTVITSLASKKLKTAPSLKYPVYGDGQFMSLLNTLNVILNRKVLPPSETYEPFKAPTYNVSFPHFTVNVSETMFESPVIDRHTPSPKVTTPAKFWPTVTQASYSYGLYDTTRQTTQTRKFISPSTKIHPPYSTWIKIPEKLSTLSESPVTSTVSSIAHENEESKTGRPSSMYEIFETSSIITPITGLPYEESQPHDLESDHLSTSTIKAWSSTFSLLIQNLDSFQLGEKIKDTSSPEIVSSIHQHDVTSSIEDEETFSVPYSHPAFATASEVNEYTSNQQHPITTNQQHPTTTNQQHPTTSNFEEGSITTSGFDAPIETHHGPEDIETSHGEDSENHIHDLATTSTVHSITDHHGLEDGETSYFEEIENHHLESETTSAVHSITDHPGYEDGEASHYVDIENHHLELETASTITDQTESEINYSSTPVEIAINDFDGIEVTTTNTENTSEETSPVGSTSDRDEIASSFENGPSFDSTTHTLEEGDSHSSVADEILEDVSIFEVDGSTVSTDCDEDNLETSSLINEHHSTPSDFEGAESTVSTNDEEDAIGTILPNSDSEGATSTVSTNDEEEEVEPSTVICEHHLTTAHFEGETSAPHTHFHDDASETSEITTHSAAVDSATDATREFLHTLIFEGEPYTTEESEYDPSIESATTSEEISEQSIDSESSTITTQFTLPTQISEGATEVEQLFNNDPIYENANDDAMTVESTLEFEGAASPLIDNESITQDPAETSTFSDVGSTTEQQDDTDCDDDRIHFEEERNRELSDTTDVNTVSTDSQAESIVDKNEETSAGGDFEKTTQIYYRPTSDSEPFVDTVYGSQPTTVDNIETTFFTPEEEDSSSLFLGVKPVNEDIDEEPTTPFNVAAIRVTSTSAGTDSIAQTTAETIAETTVVLPSTGVEDEELVDDPLDCETSSTSVVNGEVTTPTPDQNTNSTTEPQISETGALSSMISLNTDVTDEISETTTSPSSQDTVTRSTDFETTIFENLNEIDGDQDSLRRGKNARLNGASRDDDRRGGSEELIELNSSKIDDGERIQTGDFDLRSLISSEVSQDDTLPNSEKEPLSLENFHDDKFAKSNYQKFDSDNVPQTGDSETKSETEDLANAEISRAEILPNLEQEPLSSENSNDDKFSKLNFQDFDDAADGLTQTGDFDKKSETDGFINAETSRSEILPILEEEPLTPEDSEGGLEEMFDSLKPVEHKMIPDELKEIQASESMVISSETSAEKLMSLLSKQLDNEGIESEEGGDYEIDASGMKIVKNGQRRGKWIEDLSNDELKALMESMKPKNS